MDLMDLERMEQHLEKKLGIKGLILEPYNNNCVQLLWGKFSSKVGTDSRKFNSKGKLELTNVWEHLGIERAF